MIELPAPLLKIEQPWNATYLLLEGLTSAIDDICTHEKRHVPGLLTDTEILSGLDAMELYIEAASLVKKPNMEWIYTGYDDDEPIYGVPIVAASRGLDYNVDLLTEITEDKIDRLLSIVYETPDYPNAEEARHQTFLMWLDRQIEGNQHHVVSALLDTPRPNTNPEIRQRCADLIENNWPNWKPGPRPFGYQPLKLVDLLGHDALPILDRIIEESPNPGLLSFAKSYRRDLQT